MNDRASSRRSYESPRRREQAAATRRAVLISAQRLFEAEGYSATSVSAIAKGASVTPKTVYLAFASKAGLMIALWNFLLRGDDAPVPIGERDWYQAILREPDPRKKIRAALHQATLARSRIAGILQVIRNAAGSDPEIDVLWQRIQSEFYENQRAIVESMESNGCLRQGLTLERATDILWSLNHPSSYLLFVVERKWSPSEFEDWVVELLCEQLLD
jgi:AcrR family transcriptional regulator